MRASLRNQLRAVKQRLDKLEPRGLIVRVLYDDDDAAAIEREARAECPRCEIMIIKVVYE